MACEDHMCRLETCFSVRQSGSYACSEHACHTTGCKRAQQALGWNFCSRHSCQWFNPCPQPVIGGSRYCEQHKCPWPSCTSSCRVVGKYCDDCKCHYNDDCHEPRTNQGWNCMDHSCMVDGCGVVLLPDGNYCDFHTCQGTTAGIRCLQQKEADFQYCKSHKCWASNCPNQTPDSPDAWFCESHQCSHEGCPKQVDAENGTLCQSHITQGLVRATKPNQRLLPSRNHQHRMIQQAYIPGYADGVMHGVNLPAQEQEDIRKTFGRELPTFSTDHQSLRDNTRDTLNNYLGNSRSGLAILGTPQAPPNPESNQPPA